MAAPGPFPRAVSGARLPPRLHFPAGRDSRRSALGLYPDSLPGYAPVVTQARSLSELGLDFSREKAAGPGLGARFQVTAGARLSLPPPSTRRTGCAGNGRSRVPGTGPSLRGLVPGPPSGP